MKTVSVIIPTHNRSQLIREAVQSVIEQDVEDCELEIIVVDDGSTDDTRQAVSIFGEKVKYIYQENQGAGVARNRGIEEASGDWVAFLDSDDLWLPDKLSLQFRVLECFPEHKVIHSNFYTFSGDRVTISKGLQYWVTECNEEIEVDWRDVYANQYDSVDYGIMRSGLSFKIYSGNLFAAFLDSTSAACWTLLIKRECLTEDMRFPRFARWTDYWFICRLSERHEFLFIDCPTAENRAHSGPRLTQGQTDVSLECYLDILEKVYLPSQSPFRPADEILQTLYKKTRSKLLKEYLKNGDLDKGRTLIKSCKGTDDFHVDLTFPFYRIAAQLPFDVTNRLVKFKKRLLGSLNITDGV